MVENNCYPILKSGMPILFKGDNKNENSQVIKNGEVK